jgi:hypothetical protein
MDTNVDFIENSFGGERKKSKTERNSIKMISKWFRASPISQEVYIYIYIYIYISHFTLLE